MGCGACGVGWVRWIVQPINNKKPALGGRGGLCGCVDYFTFWGGVGWWFTTSGAYQLANKKENKNKVIAIICFLRCVVVPAVRWLFGLYIVLCLWGCYELRE